MPLILPLTPEHLSTLAEIIAVAGSSLERRRQLLERSALSGFERKVDLEGASLDFAFRLIDALQWRNDGEAPPPALTLLLRHLSDAFGGQPEALEFLQLLSGLRPVEQERPLPLDPDLTCPAQYLVPEPFAGRDEALAALTARLQPRRTIVLQGTGGVGKTTLAYAAAHRLHHSGAVCSVLYADITPSPDPVTVLRGWAAGARMEPDFTTNTLPQIALQVKERLSHIVARGCTGNGRVLVLLDNVFDNGIEAVNLLKHASPANATWLVTTRSETVADALDASLVPLDTFDRAHGLDFLHAYLNEADERASGALDRLLGDLAEALGGHALALKLAAARIKKEARRPPRDLMTTIERLVPVYREGLSAGDPLEKLGLDASHPALRELQTHSLSHSFRLSYDELADTPPAQAYFRAMGVLAYGAPSDTELLAALWECESAEAGRVAELLAAAALLERTESAGWYRMHPLLRTFARALLSQAGEQDEVFNRYAAMMVNFLGSFEISDLLREWEMLSLYLPHVSAVGDALAASPAADTEGQELRLGFAVYVAEWLSLRREMHRPAWLEMGREAAMALEQPDLRLQLSNHLLSYYARTGNRGWAEALEQEVRRLAGSATNPELLIQTYYHGALAAVTGGNLPGAMAQLEQILPLLDQSTNPYIVGNVGLLLGLVLIAQGSPVQARYYLEMALPELKASGDRLGETDALLMLAQAHALLGQPDLVIEKAQQAADLYRAMGLDFNVAGAQLPIGEAWLQKGEPERAYEILAEALPRLRQTQDANVELRAISSMGFACALRGRLEEGFALARQTIALAEPLGNAQHLGNGYVLLGQLHTKANEPEQAMAHFDKAYAVLKESGYLMLAGIAAYHAGVLAAGRGDGESGERYLRLATEHLLDMGSSLGLLAAQRLVELLQARGEAADINDFIFSRWVAIMERVRAAMRSGAAEREELRDELEGRREMITGLVGDTDAILPLIDGLLALLESEAPMPLPADHPLAEKFRDLVREIGHGGAQEM